MKKIFRHWKIIYAVCCLIYVGWMIHAGANEFDRINGQYRRLKARLEPDIIRTVAYEELSEECRKAVREKIIVAENACNSWKPEVVAARALVVEERFITAKQRGTVKLVLFYAGFVIIFLLAPIILLYLLIAAIILLYKNIKIVR